MQNTATHMTHIKTISKCPIFKWISETWLCNNNGNEALVTGYRDSTVAPATANRPVSQMQALLAAYRELVVDYDTLPKLQYVFWHKT